MPTYEGGNYYLVALKDHVNLGFSTKGLTPEAMALFEGTGKTMRHLKVSSLEEIDRKRIVRLLTLIEKRQV